MDKLISSAVGDGGPLHHSKFLIQQSLGDVRGCLNVDTFVTLPELQSNFEPALSNIRGCLAEVEGIKAVKDVKKVEGVEEGETSRVTAQEDINPSFNKEDTLSGTGQQHQSADEKMDLSIKMKLDKLDHSTDLKELEDYFTALEEDRRNLHYLLEEQKQEQEMELNAIERERLQESLEWEVIMKEREEALRSALMSVAMSKDMMKKELMARLVVRTSTVPAPAPPNNVLREIAKLEKRVRSTEMRKQQKALQKAERAEKKQQQKALQKAQMEARKAEKAGGKKKGKKLEGGNDSSSNQPGCSTQSNVMAAERDKKDNKKTVGCFGLLFKRRRAAKDNTTVTEQ